MSCLQTLNGVSLECGNVGGLSEIYIANVRDVASVTIGTTGATAGQISAIGMTGAAKFKKYSFRRGNASMTSTGNRNDANGTSFQMTEITATFNRMDLAKHREFNSIAKGNLYVIVKDRNGEFWFVGYDHYVTASVTAASGAQGGDANNYSITLSSETNELPLSVSPSIIAALIA